MSTHLRPAVLIVVTVLVLCPVPARADGLISWLDKLSGPGPWLGLNLSVCLTTFGRDGASGGPRSAVISCRDSDLRERHWSWYVNAGAGLALDNDLNYAGQDLTGKSDRVTYLKAGTSVMYTLRPALDLGAGAGFLRFQGPRFSGFAKPYLQPVKVGVRPLLIGYAGDDRDEVDERGWLLLTADWVILLGTIDGARFGAPADSLRESNENLLQLGFSIDVPRLLRLARRR
jgi:hypothetical protein